MVLSPDGLSPVTQFPPQRGQMRYPDRKGQNKHHLTGVVMQQDYMQPAPALQNSANSQARVEKVAH